jgi:hypothetical protein
VKEIGRWAEAGEQKTGLVTEYGVSATPPRIGNVGAGSIICRIIMLEGPPPAILRTAQGLIMFADYSYVTNRFKLDFPESGSSVTWAAVRDDAEVRSARLSRFLASLV